MLFNIRRTTQLINYKDIPLLTDGFFEDRVGNKIRLDLQKILSGDFSPVSIDSSHPMIEALRKKIEDLKADNIVIEEQDIPGLWRINGGPEITTKQLFLVLSNYHKGK